MADTNVQSSPDEQLRIIQGLLGIIMTLYAERQINTQLVKTAVDRLNDEMIKYMQLLNEERIANGETVMIQPVKERHLEDIKQHLVRQNIPFIVYPDGSGNHVFAIRSQDKEQFIDIQSSVYNHSVDGYTDKTPENILDTYKHIGDKDAIVLQLKDKNMEQAALDSLLENNIVGAKLDDRIIISSAAANFKDNGKDLDKVKLDIALYAATRNYIPPQFAKEWEASEDEQRAYDNKAINEAISELKKGGKVALASPTDPFAPAVVMKSSGDGEIEAARLEYNSETNTFEETKLDISLDDNEDDIRYFLSVQTMDIPRLCRMEFNEYENEIQGESFNPEVAEGFDSRRPEKKQNAEQINRFLDSVKSISEEINKKATELVNKTPNVTQMTAMEASVLKDRKIREIFEKNLQAASSKRPVAEEYRIENFNEMNLGNPPLMQAFRDSYEGAGTVYKERVTSLQQVIDQMKVAEYQRAQEEEYQQTQEQEAGPEK